MALKCEVCGRLFGQKNKFEAHKLLCGNQVRPFTCSEPGCPKAYRTKWMFDNHTRTVHAGVDQDPVTFTCEYCARHLGSKQALDTHRKQKHFKKVGQMNIGSQFRFGPNCIGSDSRCVLRPIIAADGDRLQ